MYKILLKRSIDIIASGVVLLLLLPLFIIIALLIIFDSKGPVFFIQERIGKNKTKFKMFKFRSMTNKKRTIHRQIFEGDSEVTKVGQFIRRTKIDELPQLINVFKGEMSLIGPRPSLPEILLKFGDYVDIRSSVRPGLSSLAAIKGSVYLDWNEKGYWDKFYAENLTFMLDVKIVIGTLKVILLGEKKMFKNLKNNGNKDL